VVDMLTASPDVHIEETKMKANVFRGTNKFGIEDVERPRAGAGEAIIRVIRRCACGFQRQNGGGNVLPKEPRHCRVHEVAAFRRGQR
jgi:hypothetical protein